MKKIIKCLLLICVVSLLFSCQLKKQDIYIFFTSDVHCAANENIGYAGLKALVDEAKKEHPNVLLIDSGDFIQGDNLGAFSKGEDLIDIMNAVGYDFATIGNHEFDYGMDRLNYLMNKSNFDYVVTNCIYSGNGKYAFEGRPEYIIKDFKGTKVAFLGILTPESITSSTPANFMEDNKIVYDFYGGDNGQRLFDKVQSVVDEVRAQKADYVIAISHLGSAEENRPYDSINLISHTQGIDAVIDGHSHSTINGDMYPNKNGEDVLVVSAGTKFENVGEIIIDDKGQISSLLISEYNQKDEAIETLVNDYYKKIEDILNEEICEIDFDLPLKDENGIRLSRNREISVANLMCDAIAYKMNTDVAIMNGGGVRTSIDKGVVTYGDLFALNPFGDLLFTIKASGQQILDALEYGAQNTAAITSLDGNAVGEFGGFIHVSGIKYTINTNIDTSVVVDESGMLKEIGEQRRVSDVYILKDGEYVLLDPNETYEISSTNYLAVDKGDGNTAFEGCEITNYSEFTITDALYDYFKYKDGNFDEYRTTQDRITIK